MIVKNSSKISNSSFNDGTLAYTFKEANEMLNALKPKQFTIADTTMILLYAQHEKPICGRVLLVKEFFLLVKEILNEYDIQDPQFVAYRYGAYSFSLGSVLSNLEFLGYMARMGNKNSKNEQFKLTNKGKEVASEIWDNLSKDIQNEIATKRMGWDQLGRDGILRLVYRKYPKYARNSYIKGRYKEISWGKDWI